jgi:hypothetical protein
LRLLKSKPGKVQKALGPGRSGFSFKIVRKGRDEFARVSQRGSNWQLNAAALSGSRAAATRAWVARSQASSRMLSRSQTARRVRARS